MVGITDQLQLGLQLFFESNKGFGFPVLSIDFTDKKLHKPTLVSDPTHCTCA